MAMTSVSSKPLAPTNVGIFSEELCVVLGRIDFADVDDLDIEIEFLDDGARSVRTKSLYEKQNKK